MSVSRTSILFDGHYTVYDYSFEKNMNTIWIIWQRKFYDIYSMLNPNSLVLCIEKPA